MDNEILKEKVNQAVGILKEKDIDMWITFVRESSNMKDPVLDMISGINFTWLTALIINKDGDTTCIVGSLEESNIREKNLYKNIVGYNESIKDLLVNYIKSKNPKQIAINFSLNSELADGLTHGMYLILNDYLKNTDFVNRLISSEEIISALKGRKTATELKIMHEAVDETLKIFDQATNFIKPGKSELEISDFIKNIVKEKGFGLAWDDDHCPAVFTGPEAGDPHSGPTKRKVEKGHMVNIDFGIQYKGYCSDLQRTWYVLKDGETEAPAEVTKGFNIIRDAIQKVADALKPGVTGLKMDTIARNFIVEQGYAEYPHGLGHQVGRAVHDGGAGLFPKWEKYGNTPLMEIEESQVFTIEPRLQVKGYGTSTLEEEVYVTKDGCKFISKPQKEIWLIK